MTIAKQIYHVHIKRFKLRKHTWIILIVSPLIRFRNCVYTVLATITTTMMRMRTTTTTATATE